ncbi:MAG: BsuBI/PstI family type II restriction endonuclease [Nitrososphaerales archaeon]
MMASFFDFETKHIRILDPGSGAGMLFAACVEEIIRKHVMPARISVTAYEIDNLLAEDVKEVFKICSDSCRNAGIDFEGELIEADFIIDSADRLGLSIANVKYFNYVIMNPPYGKISSSTETYKTLRSMGMETPNYYAAFMTLAERLLEDGGQMVSITPRSFCNGPYFKPFRRSLLDTMSIRRIHLFTSRTQSFRADEVLQENIILYSAKGKQDNPVIISSSEGPDEVLSMREVDKNKIISPDDPEYFIHIVPDELSDNIAQKMGLLKASLSDIGLSVSTGKIVDFRSERFLQHKQSAYSAPLIGLANINSGGFVRWPITNFRKPQYISVTPETKSLLLPKGNYVIVKRFAANEEKKRIVAAVYDTQRFDAPLIGFENKVNYFHNYGSGLDVVTAKGLAVFLNSTLADSFFRQFSGHTQVNSTDLRNFKYPTLTELEMLGKQISDEFPDQNQLDDLVQKVLFDMSKESSKLDPVAAKQKINEALSILEQLGLPREQQNERSALTLLTLVGLKPRDPWSEAKDPLCGITPMMEFFAENYGKKYAPNSRETVRRFTVHQFLQAGLIVENPDKPDRPTNSPLAVYKIERSALELLCTFGTTSWEKNLQAYRASVKSLSEKYARERERRQVPIRIGARQTIQLSPGGQNVLIKKIVEVFLPAFAPKGKVLYIGDTGEKIRIFEKKRLEELGVKVNLHGKMPDVIIHYKEKNWLLLIEAVTSHGPINPKRREELEKIFTESKAGIVYVTAFLSRAAMVSYLRDMSWETEVWVAESPSHMIHFNGERFLGPYE